MTRHRHLVAHLARIGVSLGALGAAVACDAAVLASGAAGALFLASFACAHDLMHKSLPLGRRARATLLGLTGQGMLASGHGTRLTHLRHHARPFAADDVEGAAATLSWPRAIAALPRLWWAMRAEPLRARGRTRRLVVAETALNLLLVVAALAFGNGALVAALVTTLAIQAAMPLWAGKIPHEVPPWLERGAAYVARSGSVIALSLAYHERHHRNPALPCAELASG